MVVHSRNGYNNGLHFLSDPSEILDIEEDGKIIKQVSAKTVISHMSACLKSGKTPKYSNMRDNRTICDPDANNDTIKFIFGVDQNGVVTKVNADPVKISSSDIGKRRSFCFELTNGFVIGIHQFETAAYMEFTTVSFSLFGEKETFSYGNSFNVAVRIYEVGKSKVRGAVFVTTEFVDSQPSKARKLGDFELTDTSTVYKGVETPVVQNMVRYSKELVLND